MKSPAELVVHPAPRHLRERRLNHVPREIVAGPLPEAQHEFPDHRLRELGRAAQAAFGLVELTGDALERTEQDVVAQELHGAPKVPAAVQLGGELLRGRHDLVAPVLPGVGDGVEDLGERRQAVAGRGRKVRPAVERGAVGREEHGHRPAPVAGHGLHGLHVDLIDVRPLLPIHLHAHEVLVHELSDVGILERLALHDVAPVTRRVADGQEHGPVLAPCLGEGVVAPRKPVHRIVSVLEEIRTRLVRKAVGHVILRLVREGQRRDGRGQLRTTGADGDERPRVGVLAPDEAQRDRTLQPERPGGAGDTPDLGAVGHHRRARRRRHGAVDDETPQVTVDVTAVADPHHDLLTDVAALRI